MRRASTPATLAAAATAAAVSAPPLADGQAVFGAATQALLRGSSLDHASMLQQRQGAAPAMTPDMAATLQVLMTLFSGLFKCADDAMTAGHRRVSFSGACCESHKHPR